MKMTSASSLPKAGRRIFMYDILRILCAILIFMRHSINMYGCDWGIFRRGMVMSTTSYIMTCFFILSGISTRLSAGDKEMDRAAVLAFYKSRFMALAPSYLILHLLYMLLVDGQMKNGAVLAPVSLLGIQTMFRSLFGIFDFGGTWFVSILLVFYLIYPLISMLLKGISPGAKAALLAFLVLLLWYANYVNVSYGLATYYDNVFFRIGEVLTGILLVDLLRESEKTGTGKIIFLGSGVLLLALTAVILIKKDIFIGIDKDVLPRLLVNILVLTFFYYIRCAALEKSRLLNYLSKLTYEIYLMQMVAWSISAWILKGSANNTAKLITCSLVTLALSALTKLIGDFLRKKYKSPKTETAQTNPA